MILLDRLTNLFARKFLIALIGIGLLVVNTKFNLQFPNEIVDAITIMICTFLVVEGGKDIVIAFKSKK